MKINIPEIEQKIYYNICSNFANWCEMQLSQYESLLKFLDSITMEEMTSTLALDFYNNYCSFCTIKKYDILPQKTFARMMTSFGYPAQVVSQGKKKVYYYKPIKR